MSTKVRANTLQFILTAAILLVFTGFMQIVSDGFSYAADEGESVYITSVNENQSGSDSEDPEYVIDPETGEIVYLDDENLTEEEKISLLERVKEAEASNINQNPEADSADSDSIDSQSGDAETESESEVDTTNMEADPESDMDDLDTESEDTSDTEYYMEESDEESEDAYIPEDDEEEEYGGAIEAPEDTDSDSDEDTDSDADSDEESEDTDMTAQSTDDEESELTEDTETDSDYSDSEDSDLGDLETEYASYEDDTEDAAEEDVDPMYLDDDGDVEDTGAAEDEAETADYPGYEGMDLSELFPKSYLNKLEKLQAEHPTWQFIPGETGIEWEEAIDAEDEGSTSLVSPDEPKSMRENSSNTYDGRWYAANRDTIEYYMDPRNFLNEDDIYQFLLQTYDAESQNADTVEDIIEGSFMEDRNPGGDFDSFAECIDAAGAESGVNPNVLAAMIIMEQGWKGSSLSSGEKEGYEDLYNFFNIGAWTTDDMSSVERGLWYAGGEGEGNDSYNRPWDSPYKAIEGGAEFYNQNYISENQNTYYTKKFNVMNGEDSVGDHQYMTNVSGALGEGKLVKMAYEENQDLPCIFQIPIFENMPKKVCKLP